MAERPVKPGTVKKPSHKPCPFCGDKEPIVMNVLGALIQDCQKIVHCLNCHAEAPLKFWNKRHDNKRFTDELP